MGRKAGSRSWTPHEDRVLVEVWLDFGLEDDTFALAETAVSRITSLGWTDRYAQGALSRALKLRLPARRRVGEPLPPNVLTEPARPPQRAVVADLPPVHIPPRERYVPPQRDRPPAPPPPVVIRVKAGPLDPGERDLVRMRLENFVLPQIAAELARHPAEVRAALDQVVRSGWKPLRPAAGLESDDIRGSLAPLVSMVSTANVR